MKLDSASAGGIILVSISFIFILTCLDWVLMTNFSFWQNPDLLYRYWIILGLIITVDGFVNAFWAYLTKLPGMAVVASFLTPLLLFAGGLLDQFYAMFSFLQGTSYSFYPWSFGEKVFVANGLLGSWGWFEQIIWAAVFYGVLGYVWYRVLKKG